MRKAIFFDRDGVLNKAIVKKDKPYSPLNIDQLIINNDAKSLIRYLKNRNFLCIVVTNQPEVGRGNVSKKTVNQINRILKKTLHFDDIFTCFHRNDLNFDKKPNPGMIFKAKKKWNIDLKRSYIVGDRYKDILAGLNAGLKTIYLFNGYKKDKTPVFYHYKINSLKQVLRKVRYD